MGSSRDKEDHQTRSRLLTIVSYGSVTVAERERVTGVSETACFMFHPRKERFFHGLY